MTNCTSIMDCTYNATAIFSADVINSPETWLAAWNSNLLGWGVLGLLLVIGIVLTVIVKYYNNEDDWTAISYSGLILTFVGIMLFVVSVSTEYKLLQWEQLSIIVVITAIAFGLKKIKERF